MATLLDEAGHLVVQAADGPAALARARGRTPFDVMLLDVGLPGMSGLDVLAQVGEPRSPSARGDGHRRRHA